MIPPVDELDALFAPLVLLVLTVEHTVHSGQLLVERLFPQLLVLNRQDQNAAEIHQRPDVENAHGHFPVQEVQVAHGKGRRRHDNGHQRRRIADVQMPGRVGALALQPVHHPEQTAVDQQQQEQRHRLSPAVLRKNGAVQLPLDAGRKFGQNEAAGAVVGCFQPVFFPRDPEVKVLHPHCDAHAGDPPRNGHLAGRFQKNAQHHGQQPAGGQRDLPRKAGRAALGVQNDGQPLGQRRVQARDIRQCRHRPSPPM